jgi:hypothetical protein
MLQRGLQRWPEMCCFWSLEQPFTWWPGLGHIVSWLSLIIIVLANYVVAPRSSLVQSLPNLLGSGGTYTTIQNHQLRASLIFCILPLMDFTLKKIFEYLCKKTIFLKPRSRKRILRYVFSHVMWFPCLKLFKTVWLWIHRSYFWHARQIRVKRT